MGSKATAIFFTCMLCMLISLPPAYSCQQNCPIPHPHPPSKPHPDPPKHHHPPKTPCPPSPPHHGGGGAPPKVHPPIILPPPVISPPIINPPGGGGGGSPPGGGGGGGSPPGGGGGSPPGGGGGGGTPPGGGGGGAKCPINALKLGLCLDVLGGLVHVGIGNPVENICCPVIQGLLGLEAAICLCTTIRLRLLNLNIFLPIALQVIATCGLTPPPGFTCPPLQ